MKRRQWDPLGSGLTSFTISGFSMIFPLVVQNTVILFIRYQPWSFCNSGAFYQNKGQSEKAGRGQSFKCEEEMRYLVCSTKASFLVKENQWDAQELPWQPIPVTCDMTTFSKELLKSRNGKSWNRALPLNNNKCTQIWISISSFSMTCLKNYNEVSPELLHVVPLVLLKTVGTLSIFNWIDGSNNGIAFYIMK